MVRAAIVGLGRWGRSLVTSVQGKTDEIRFVLGHTRTPQSAEAFCRDQGVMLTDSYEAILADRDIDAVVIATPHSQHEAQVVAAAQAGKHVFCEKPITLDRRSADAAVAMVRKAGLVLAVGFTRRFHPAIGEMRNRLKDGRLGTLLAMVGQHCTSTGHFIAPENWRADPAESPAGAMTAVGVHLLDHMIEFGGRVRDVRCITMSGGTQRTGDDTTTVLLRFESGVTGTIFCSVATATNFNFTIYGTRGLAEVSRGDLSVFRFVPGSTQAPTGPVTAPPDEIAEFPGFDTLNAEMIEFARCVREGRPFPVTVNDVLHGMSVFDGLVKSAASGQIEPVVDHSESS
jgi:predicted dehydrogenase